MIFSKHIYQSIVVIFVTAMLFSCQGKLKEIREWHLESSAPKAIGKGINLFYTDSGKVRVHLKSPLLHDYSTQDFPYREFPDGIHVEFIDEQQQVTTIKANYAIFYPKTNLIDLQGDVVITTSDSTVLKANQLYWDKAQQWVFTDKPYSIQLPDGGFNKGSGFDSDEDFKQFSSRSNTGIQIVKEEVKDTL